MQYANGDLEEALSSPVPTQQPHYGGQMSVEEIDGGANSGSYAAGQQQRRIIREIIVWKILKTISTSCNLSTEDI